MPKYIIKCLNVGLSLTNKTQSMHWKKKELECQQETIY